MGTANLLHCLKSVSKKCSAILITTDKVYHNNESGEAFVETDRYGGFDPYSSSKACCELVIDSFRSSFFNLENISVHQKGIASARAGNVIGGGDWSEDRLIPDIINSFASHKEVVIRNPSSVRPWQHVLEPIAGYLKLGYMNYHDPVNFSGGWNFGPLIDDVMTVKEVLECAIKHWEGGAYRVQDSAQGFHEANHLMLNIEKATHKLGWSPTLVANEAIDWTMDWYRKFYKGEIEMNKFSEEQINTYTGRI